MTLIKPVSLNKFAYKKYKNDDVSLSPLIKWTGGKRREIKLFEKYFPNFVLEKKPFNYIEPFVGGGAVYWYLNNVTGINIINDFDLDLVNFYKIYSVHSSKFVSSLREIGDITDHDSLEKVYYSLRDKDKSGGLNQLSDTDRAIRFFVVNQLAFSGMRRFNSNGEFNVPFGHYKGLNVDVLDSVQHRLLLNKTEIHHGDFEQIMLDNDKENSFIYLDPPYTRVFKEYSANNSFGEKDHIRLSNTIHNIKNANVMLIIDKSDFTESLYKDLIVDKYSLSYGVNIKNRFNTSVEHLIICNY